MWLRTALSSVVSVSWPALTVTVCAVLQLDVVKVSVFWVSALVLVSKVTSVLSLATVTVTLALGAVLSFTV